MASAYSCNQQQKVQNQLILTLFLCFLLFPKHSFLSTCLSSPSYLFVSLYIYFTPCQIPPPIVVPFPPNIVWTLLHAGLRQTSGGADPAPRQHQRAEEELHGGCSRAEAERVGQASVHSLSVSYAGYQRSASTWCRRGKCQFRN